MKMREKRIKGFTMIELIIVIGIVGILGGTGFGSYLQFRNKAVTDHTSSQFVEEVRLAISKARGQEDGATWTIGVYNATATPDYYQISGSSTKTVYLSNTVRFSNPSSGNSWTRTLQGGPNINILTATASVTIESLNASFSDIIDISRTGVVTRTSNYE